VPINVRPFVPSRLTRRPGHESGRIPTSAVAGYIALTKPRIIELLLITTIPTMVVANDGWPSLWLMVVTMVGGTLAAGGANAINMYIDRDIDALMERTKNRPLVTGLISPRNGLIFAISLEIVAFLVLWAGTNLLSGILALSATLFYVFIYSLWLKRTSKQNIVIGGAAGAVPVLVGWAAVTNSLSWTPWLLFLVIFLWTPPHFWALAIKYKDDYANAGVPMLPVVATKANVQRQMWFHTIAMIISSIVLIETAQLPLWSLFLTIILGLIFARQMMQLRESSDNYAKAAAKIFQWSISYLSLYSVLLVAAQLLN